MTSLDDQLYQLFSDLLRNSKQQTGLTFENSLLATGVGPFLTKMSATEKLYLGPRASVLGYGHPLTYKTRLESFLRPEVYSDEAEQDSFIANLNHFIKSVTGNEIYASLAGQSGIETLDAGRYPTFLSDKSLEYISSGKVVLIPNLFSFPIFLSNKNTPDEYSVFLTQDALSASQATLKLLSLGDFYGERGHIQRVSQVISERLASCTRVKSIDGLLIYLDQDRNYSFLDEGKHIIYLPLFFRPSFIKEINKFIME